MMVAPADAKRLICPACGRFLVNTDGTYVDCPPCKFCGAQTSVNMRGFKGRADGRAATTDSPGTGRLEAK